MFALRGIAVSLSFLVVLYCLVSLLVAIAWRTLSPRRELSPRALANCLFAARVFPLLTSVLFTFAFVVPSFLRLEPHAVDEGLGAAPVLLGSACLLLFAWGLYRVISAQAQTARTVARWMEGANAIETEAATPAFRTNCRVPPVTLVGVSRPRVLVSEATISVLNRDELRVAVRHEMAHVRSRDNLKKLLFRFSAFPGMGRLEGAWSEAAEVAADDAAVSSVSDALDLAAALLKLCRLVPVEPPPAVLALGLVGRFASVSARVARLLDWNETKTQSLPAIRWYAIVPALAAIALVAATYGPALTFTHRVTEWLVR